MAITRNLGLGTVGVGVVLFALTMATVLLWNQRGDADAARALDQRYLQVARQGVLDLTTISAATVDEDVARVLDRSTGSFREDFSTRAADVVAVVTDADVSATGAVTEAGIESSDDAEATVLVAATSTVTNSSGAQEEPRNWRLRVVLEDDGTTIAMSDVEFVP